MWRRDSWGIYGIFGVTLSLLRSSLPREHRLELLARILAPAQVRVLAFCSKVDHIAAIKAPEYAPFGRPSPARGTAPPRNRHYPEWDGAG
jgi:hypothetical protein